MSTAHCYRSERGFTIVEMLVAVTIMMAVTGAVFGLIDPAQGVYRAQPEVSDMQQRLRVGTSSLSEDLLMAGAGTYLGSGSGTLLNFFAPIQPVRLGTVDSDPDAGIFFRDDAITIMYVPQTASQCTIRDSMPQTSSEVKVNAQPGCPANDELCGFETGMRVIIFDDTGAWDPFTITNVQTSALHLQHRDDDFSKKYDQGAQITQIAMHTYYLLTNTATSTYQLRHYNGHDRDEALADNVVDLEFEYWGDSRPPMLLKPVLAGVADQYTNYGPKPPVLGVDNDISDEYAAGENCVFHVDVATGTHASSLPDLALDSQALQPLTEAMLTDGPWCPNNASPTRFDADLLRVRKVGVRLRVQVESAMLRGPAGTLFTRGGTSAGGAKFIPDQAVRFDITPRNMNFGR
ncbi:MAG: prepilin-type N-terminal cleavage/methylation domain-containing protein [Acidobacteria bacterium]|nr:prepilin-type N-terminal cleavage/methylation domain-containing protein [Acidobacteriota bacterium]